MAILRNDTTVRSADGQSTSPIITAANIGNYGISTTSTYYIGTTQNVFNRASGAQTLTGVSIDGNAANITAYTINQNVGTGNAPSFTGMTSTAMLVASTSMNSVDDWQNSPISIRERGLVAAAQSANTYSPNLNFHWASRISNSLWMDANGNLSWGSYDGTGVPSSDGAFYTNNLYASIYFDKNNTVYYLDAANSGTSLLVAGNIGAGLTSPLHKIQATGLISASDATYNNDSTFIGAILNNDGTNPGLDLRRWNGGAAGTNNHGATYIATNSVGDTIFYNGLIAANTRATNEKMRIAVNGNVGMGTTSPSYKLDVVGSVRATTDNNFSFVQQRSATNTWCGLGYLTGASSKWFVGLRETGDDNLRWYNYTNSSERMVLTESGNVGIGTTSPSQKLHVVGTGFASTDFRAPIFYDSDNTVYYIDPASTSNINVLTVNGNTSLQKFTIGNRNLIYSYYHGGAQDLAWKKIADVLLPNSLYSAASFKVNVVDAQGNFGWNTDCRDLTYFISCRRSGGVLNDYDDAVLAGPINDYIRIVKTSQGVYELQIRQIQDWQQLYFQFELISGGAGYVTYVSGTPANGSTTGTIYTVNTANANGYTQYYPVVSASASMRSPIFYDSNNTSYYIDPASTSIVNSFKVYDALYFGDYTTYISQATPYLKITTPSGYGNFGSANSSWFHMTTDRPNFYMAVGLHINGDLFIYNTQSQLTSTSVRAPIFYDSGDTTYYLDPANTGTALAIAGNAGVGTASPTLSSGKGIHINSSSGHANLKLQSSGRTWELLSTTGAYFSVYDTTGGADRLAVTSAGNVGVATTSADTNLQVVGHVHVGNQTAFDNTGGWNKTIYLDGTVHARMRIIGSAFASGKNSQTETNIWVDNSVAPYSGLTTNAGSFTINAGFTTLTNSARSPIFYDSDNTSYYVDAASTTVLNALSVSVNNGLNPAVGIWHTSSEGKARFYFASNGTTYFRTGNDFVFRNNSDSGVVVIDSSGNLRTTTGGDNSPSYSLHVGGTGYAVNDFRSPIFYDSNDTTYYVDPASSTISSYLKTSQFIGRYKTFVINSLSASLTQARTYEIARIAIDYNDWNSTGTFEVELHEQYYSRGLKKVYNIQWGYSNTYSIKLVEYRGTGDNNFQCRIGTPVLQSGDNYYLPVYVDVRNYGIVDVVIKTNRNYTTSTGPAIADTYINPSPSPTNISDFTADSDLEISTLNNAKLNGNPILSSYNYTSYTLPIGGSWYGVNLPGTRWNGMSVNGGEIVFGRDLPNNGQMGILVDGCYIAGENNGFWSLSSSNDWTTRRGMYWDGTYLNFTTNSAISLFSDARSPRFYDSDNTSYYIDPASTSNIVGLTTGSMTTTTGGTSIFIGNQNVTTANALRINWHTDADLNYYIGKKAGSWTQPLDINFYTGIRLYSHSSYDYGISFWNSNGTTLMMSVGESDNNVRVKYNIYAQILYDLNNTSYYIDPASTSSLNALTMAGTITGALDATVSFTGGVCTAASYNYILNGANDTGNKLVIFVNGSTRTADGGVNALTIRNDGGAFVLGSGSYLTSILGSSVTINGNTALTSASTLTAGNLSGTIPSAVLGNSTLYVGTTAIALNRGSASQSLTGVNIDGSSGSCTGNAATATNSTQLGGVAAANYVRNDVDGTDSTALFRLTTITKSLTITTSWLDTGIVGANLATGCYMISVYVDNYAVNGGHYQETYTGMMSWFSTGTNATDYDEIVLHKSGHAPNGAYINLRTIRQLSGSTNLKLQIISSVSTSGASNYVFKFRRLI